MTRARFKTLVAIIGISATSAFSFPPSFVLKPIRASGVEGVHWFLDPDSREITLSSGDRMIVLEAYIREFGPNKNLLVAGAGLDCGTFQASTGE
ncbi:MAG: hypothetical protein ACYTHJ_11305 [Planctomycetota bacterium]|jgi:hypothetical protein